MVYQWHEGLFRSNTLNKVLHLIFSGCEATFLCKPDNQLV